MKKTCLLLIVLYLISTKFIVAELYVVSTNTYLRKDPSIRFAAIGKIEYGSKISVTDTKISELGTWNKITVSKNNIFVYNKNEKNKKSYYGWVLKKDLSEAIPLIKPETFILKNFKKAKNLLSKNNWKKRFKGLEALHRIVKRNLYYTIKNEIINLCILYLDDSVFYNRKKAYTILSEFKYSLSETINNLDNFKSVNAKYYLSKLLIYSTNEKTILIYLPLLFDLNEKVKNSAIEIMPKTKILTNNFAKNYFINHFDEILKKVIFSNIQTKIVIMNFIKKFKINIDSHKNIISELMMTDNIQLKKEIIDLILNCGSRTVYLNSLRLLLLDENKEIKIKAANAINEIKK